MLRRREESGSPGRPDLGPRTCGDLAPPRVQWKEGRRPGSEPGGRTRGERSWRTRARGAHGFGGKSPAGQQSSARGEGRGSERSRILQVSWTRGAAQRSDPEGAPGCGVAKARGENASSHPQTPVSCVIRGLSPKLRGFHPRRGRVFCPPLTLPGAHGGAAPAPSATRRRTWGAARTLAPTSGRQRGESRGCTQAPSLK